MHVRHIAIALGVLACAWTAQADVTIVAQMKGKMMGMNPSGETVTYIKGLKMRTDQTMGRDQTSTIMDVESGRMIAINHRKKEAEVWNMAELTASLQQAGVTATPNVQMKSTGETKEIAGYTA